MAGEPAFSWCNVCLTTSRYRTVLHIVTPDGMTPLAYATGCVRCDGVETPAHPDRDRDS